MKMFRQKTTPSYSTLVKESEKDAESGPFLPSSEAETPPRQRLWPFVLPWIGSTILLLFVSFYQYLNSLPAQEPYSFSKGWRTDFGEYILFQTHPT